MTKPVVMFGMRFFVVVALSYGPIIMGYAKG